MGRPSQTPYNNCPTPAEVRVTRRHHPLEGQVVKVLAGGPAQMVVRLRDGTSMRLPRAWTDADGASPSKRSEHVFSAEALRELIEHAEGLRRLVEGRESSSNVQEGARVRACAGGPSTASAEQDWRSDGDFGALKPGSDLRRDSRRASPAPRGRPAGLCGQPGPDSHLQPLDSDYLLI